MNLSTLTNTDLFHKAIDLNLPTMDKLGRLCKRETLIDAINCRLAKIRKKRPPVLDRSLTLSITEQHTRLYIPIKLYIHSRFESYSYEEIEHAITDRLQDPEFNQGIYYMENQMSSKLHVVKPMSLVTMCYDENSAIPHIVLIFFKQIQAEALLHRFIEGSPYTFILYNGGYGTFEVPKNAKLIKNI